MLGWVLLGLRGWRLGYGAYMRAKTVEMTKMPELVAFFHSMIGLGGGVHRDLLRWLNRWAFGISARRAPPIPHWQSAGVGAGRCDWSHHV